MGEGVHVSEVVVVEHVSSITFDVVGPDCRLGEGVGASVSERVEGLD